MIRKSLLGLSLAAAVLAGCGAQPGMSVVKYDTNGEVHKTMTPEAGTYMLYSKFATNPEVTYELKKGDELGFAMKDNEVYSVAGDHMDRLKPGFMSGYYWKMRPPTAPMNDMHTDNK